MKTSILMLVLMMMSSSLFIHCDCRHFNGEEGECYFFDRRQCDGDEWSQLVPIGDSELDQEEKMEKFLESKDIEVIQVNLVTNFHEFVCEACFVCPTGDRFFIEVAEGQENQLKALELLSFEADDCSDI